MKLSGYAFSCNSLTNFEYEVHAMTGNGNKLNYLGFLSRKTRREYRELLSSRLDRFKLLRPEVPIQVTKVLLI